MTDEELIAGLRANALWVTTHDAADRIEQLLQSNEALLSLPAVYAHQINTGVREVYDPLQRFYLMEDVLRALLTEKPHDRA